MCLRVGSGANAGGRTSVREGEKDVRRKKKKCTEERLIILEVNSYCTQEGTQDFGGYFLIGKFFFWSLKLLFSKQQVGSGDLTVRGKYFNLISLPNLFFFLISIPLLRLKSRV